MTFELRPFHSNDKAWLVAEHARHYADAEGFDDSFGPLVAQIVDGFITHVDPQWEAGWIAESDGERLGSIFCVRNDDKMAKLRLFYVVVSGRGTGVAQALLSRCLAFATDAGYKGMTLWTHESHRAAGAIYARNGFARVACKPVHSFGVDLVEETWQIAF